MENKRLYMMSLEKRLIWKMSKIKKMKLKMMLPTLNDSARPIVWRIQTPPKDVRLNSSLSDNEAEPLDHLFIS